MSFQFVQEFATLYELKILLNEGVVHSSEMLLSDRARDDRVRITVAQQLGQGKQTVVLEVTERVVVMLGP